MIHDVAKEVKRAERTVKADELKNAAAIDELCDLNAKRIYYETLVRKLNRVAGK